jgi:uncharacterized damage-inducible protein DinB
MEFNELLADAFGRVSENVHDAVEELTPEQLAMRPDGRGNSIAWLVWHLTRVQDGHITDLAGTPQCWIANGWAERFGLPMADEETGYGHTPEKAATVQVESAGLLTDYFDDVHRQTLGYLRTLTAEDLDRIVDRNWDPPVTLGVRLVSVINDCTQHAGQAAYVRGLLQA